MSKFFRLSSSGWVGTNEIIARARSPPSWSIGEGRSGPNHWPRAIRGHRMLPWLSPQREIPGAAMRVSLYRPGDDVEVEGDVIGEITAP